MKLERPGKINQHKEVLFSIIKVNHKKTMGKEAGFVNERFKIINRETAVISDLLTAGLEAIRRIHLSQASYYQSFYAISMGIERLIKLILHLEQPKVDPKKYSHRLDDLSKTIGINFANQKICNTIILFLSDFARRDRYTIVDYLYNGNGSLLNREPISKFYQSCVTPILLQHPPNNLSAIPELDEVGFTRQIKEDLNDIISLSQSMLHAQKIQHAAHYVSMYFGRILQPYIKRLILHEGNPNPYFSEYFRYLIGDDKYFIKRKRFRS